MANEVLKRDDNSTVVAGAITDDGNDEIRNLQVDSNGRLKVSAVVTGSTPLTTKGDLLVYTTVEARLPVGTNGQVLTVDSSEASGVKWAATSGGDFSGPGSSTDNAIVRFDGTGGKTGQNSGVTIDDSDNVAGVGTLNSLTLPSSNFVGLTDTQTLTNKTLTTPVISSISNSGTITVPTGTDTLVARATTDTLTNKTLTNPVISQINDSNGNEALKLTATGSAVNEITIVNSATSNGPEIQATGGDTNIDLKLTPKGTGIVKGERKMFQIRLEDSTSSLSTGTGKGGDYRISPERAITIKSVGAYVDTAAATGTDLLTIDINEAGTTILSTKITIDVGEKTSTTAATAPVISDSSVAADAIITFDIDQVNETTPAQGLVVWVEYEYS